jgi:Helix-turn-helix domain
LSQLKFTPVSAREDLSSPLNVNLLTCAQLAKELDLVPETVRKWTRRKILPAFKIGRNYIRYDRNDVLRALAKYRQEEEGAK